MRVRLEFASTLITLLVAGAGVIPGDGVPRAAGAFPGVNGLLTFVGGGRVVGLDPASGAVTELGTGLTVAWAPDGRRLALGQIPAPADVPFLTDRQVAPGQ